MDRYSLTQRIAVVTASLIFAASTLIATSAAAELSPEEGYGLAAQLLSTGGEKRKAVKALLDAKDVSLAPALIDALFFIPRAQRSDAIKVLEATSGESFGDDYYAWVEWLGKNGDSIQPKAGYIEWKSLLLQRVDPTFREILFPGAAYKIRLEEIVWGGVKVDGIPPIEGHSVIPASEAKYLDDDEKVFGVSVDGTHRAYPVRFLSWHEMLNDEVDGTPVTLSFCTLCGSGIAYSGIANTNEGKTEPLTFGTSGLLFRSNKLMYDRTTKSLWNNLTGKAVVGEMATKNASLDIIPFSLTTWGRWRARHPQTTTLSLSEIKKRYRNERYRYAPGAADRARRGVSFPVWQSSDRLPRDTQIYAIEWRGSAKAFPLESLKSGSVVNSSVGESPIVLWIDDDGTVRAFNLAEVGLTDASGAAWTAEEAELVSGDSKLVRIPGHVALWFGWYGFHPTTEIYEP